MNGIDRLKSTPTARSSVVILSVLFILSNDSSSGAQPWRPDLVDWTIVGHALRELPEDSAGPDATAHADVDWFRVR